MKSALIAQPRLGLAYRDEVSTDRDDDYALWPRMRIIPGSRRPEFTRVHPLRQRELMREMLCQVCREEAAHDARGWLFLLPDARADWTGWPETMANGHPPLCEECVEPAAAFCPHLVGGLAVRVKQPVLHGVYGTQFRLAPNGLVAIGSRTVSYEDPAVAWVLAAQMVRILNGCSIDEPLTAHLARGAMR
ncbi:hypothetical protein [Streptomyces sp. S1D4-20]|uniref:hypothetical protein n=1 Tax=Streptomyces sp. S1D4-20 TaxID=2594462 RepID=UPI0011628E4E|nr:hypothetical protein [Streptomyces sp. S1D4-20]QDN54115.1 hypothetical protein FNV67_00610 [Streptomyces sp. S1D4-20]